MDSVRVDRSRRDFLARFCQGAAAAFIPSGLGRLGFSSAYPLMGAAGNAPGGEFHLHPHYRSQTPLDAALLKVKAGTDEFVTETYADQIAAILDRWSKGLLQSPPAAGVVAQSLAAGFAGCSPMPVESRLVRPGPIVEGRRNKFSTEASLDRNTFLQQLRSSLASFSKLLTADFQVTSIDASAMSGQTPGRLSTRVRYEIAGTGPGFHREQRVGYWELEWESAGPDDFRVRKWRSPEEIQSKSFSPVFSDITAATLGRNASYSEQLLRGTDYWRTVLDAASGIDIYGHNGVAAGDIDGDGFDDLYICQPAGLPNRLYRNRGDGTFEDITEASGVGVLENTACALFVDVNNDGRQELIVVRANGPLLFMNDGTGKFRQQPEAFRFATPPQGTFTGAAVADYDRDGWLDIYFCLYVYYQGSGQYKYPSPYYDAENGPPNFLMRNNRDETFRDVTRESGLDRNNTRYSFCCGWSDYDQDGWPDLYVVNDFGRKNLYRNNGDGTFRDVAAQAGVEDTGAGMGVCWLDYDNDGRPDLYVADMWTAAGERITEQENFQKNAPKEARALYRKHAMGNSLFHSQGKLFRDATGTAGVGIGRWAWSSDAWDFDHDGFPDLYVANGMVSGPLRDDLNSFFWRQVVAYSPSEARPSHNYEQGWSAINELIRSDSSWSGYERNVFYVNNGDGTFSDASGAVELDFLEDGRAFALADFDHDGRQELFLKNRNGPQLRIVKNVAQQLPPSVAFCLRGVKSNRDAIGASITVETEAGRQTRTLQAGSGFLSQHSKEIFFGLGRATGPIQATIRWPSGLVQELRDLPLNHRLWITEGAAPSRMEPFKPAAGPSADWKPQIEPPLPEMVETWLLAPVSAPEVSLPDLAGQAHKLSSLRGKPVLLNFWAMHAPACLDQLNVFGQSHRQWKSRGLQLLTVSCDGAADEQNLRALARERRLSFPILPGSEDVAGIYNILYRYLFDRHRDLELPASFLINGEGEIVKVYQGPVRAERVSEDFRHIPRNATERMAKALPFPGVTDAQEFSRNYLSYGSVFFQRGYFEQAEASFKIALQDNPSSAEALYGLGSVYLNQQKTAEARASFERAVQLEASYPDTMANAWNNLGLLSAREGQMPQAIASFQEALRLSPEHVIALDNLGSAYRQLKQWENAQKAFARALEISPQDAEANYGLAMVYAQNDDTKQAYEYLQRALRSRPDYPEALNNLGILYLRTQRRDEAVASFEKCIQAAPAFDQSYLNLARVYALEGTSGKAREVLLQLLKQHPDHPQAQKMLAQLPQ